jgi:hypothetical protein
MYPSCRPLYRAPSGPRPSNQVVVAGSRWAKMQDLGDAQRADMSTCDAKAAPPLVRSISMLIHHSVAQRSKGSCAHADAVSMFACSASSRARLRHILTAMNAAWTWKARCSSLPACWHGWEPQWIGRPPSAGLPVSPVWHDRGDRGQRVRREQQRRLLAANLIGQRLPASLAIGTDRSTGERDVLRGTTNAAFGREQPSGLCLLDETGLKHPAQTKTYTDSYGNAPGRLRAREGLCSPRAIA